MRKHANTIVIVAVALLVLALLLFAGCNPRPIPTRLDAAQPTSGTCQADPTSADVCNGKFTREGWACVRCTGAAGCLLPDAKVWCVSSCADPACHVELPDGPVP